MSVIIEPAEQLVFQSPFTHASKESLFVKNPSDRPIIFKVKTTAPRQYCVRPNAGKIEAGSEVEVQIILQPFKEELAPDFKCKDKFLVQTASFNETLEEDITSMWSHIESTDRQSMHQYKIKCVFSREVENPSSDVPKPIVSANGIKSIPQPSIPIIQPAPTDPLPPVPISREKEKLIEALEKIKILKKEIQQLKESRDQMDVPKTSRKLASSVQPLDAVYQHLAHLEKPRPVEGYPPQVLMGISIMVFIFTYLFF